VKNQFGKLAPAVEVYDGPYYKTIRKAISDNTYPKDLRIFIISAKYGLLDMNDNIDFYDQRINKKRAKELQQSVLDSIAKVVSKEYKELVINLGEDYLPVIEGIETVLHKKCKVRYFAGTIIQRRKQLKEYLLNGTV
jgi:cytoplasmic iron level regulating protein YaaA (DUF328/UPF0246 family)